MKKYLFNTPIWLEPTENIRELNLKSILIYMPDGYVIDGYVSVKQGSNLANEKGKVSVGAIYVVVPDGPWECIGVSNMQSKQIKIPEIIEYLDADAINLISISKDPADKGTLILRLPDDLEND